MLTVAEHANMLSAQYLASAFRESHPIHHIVTSPSGPRSLKQTLQSAFHNDVAPYLENGIVPRGHYSDVKNKIHADFVRKAISTRQTNIVLNQPAPPIHVSESRLPRAHRSAMAQLRSGHCSALNVYLVRVGRANLPACPQCGVDDHTPSHLFECILYPTALTPIDL